MKSYEIVPELVPKLPEHIKGWRLKLFVGNAEIDGGIFQPSPDGYLQAFQQAERFITDSPYLND